MVIGHARQLKCSKEFRVILAHPGVIPRHRDIDGYMSIHNAYPFYLKWYLVIHFELLMWGGR